MSDQDIIDNSKAQIFVNFLKNNLKKIIILLTLIIIFISSYYIFKNYKNKLDLKISENFIEAQNLINKGNKIEAKKILLEIINKKHKFYSPSALNLIQENSLVNNDNLTKELFDKVIEIRGHDSENKNLIIIKKALFLFEKGTEKQMLETLNPIINSNSVWRVQAIQILANYFKSRGENKKSKEYLELLKAPKN